MSLLRRRARGDGARDARRYGKKFRGEETGETDARKLAAVAVGGERFGRQPRLREAGAPERQPEQPQILRGAGQRRLRVALKPSVHVAGRCIERVRSLGEDGG